MINIQCPSFSCTGETLYDETSDDKLEDLVCTTCGTKLDTRKQTDKKWVKLFSECGYEGNDWSDKREFDHKGHPDYEHCAYEQIGIESQK